MFFTLSVAVGVCEDEFLLTNMAVGGGVEFLVIGVAHVHFLWFLDVLVVRFQTHVLYVVEKLLCGICTYVGFR